MKTAAAAVAVALLWIPGVAWAQRHGVHTHDGFFLQMDLGVGGLGSASSDGFGLSGSAGEFSIAAGGVVAENLILAGHLWGASAVDPTLRLDGEDVGTIEGTNALSAVGLNLTYYLMPINLYLSATPSITQVVSEEDGERFETEPGLGLRLAIGKEWWVSDDWGLGLNGHFAYSVNRDQGFDAPLVRTAWFGVAFSATFN